MGKFQCNKRLRMYQEAWQSFETLQKKSQQKVFILMGIT